MEIERDSYCFVCGRDNPAGMHLEFKREGSVVRARFSLPREYQGYNNLIHGGIISLILDEAMAHLQGKDERFLTGKITVRFSTPLLSGEVVNVSAWVERDRGSSKLTRAVMVKDSGEKVAEAEAIMFVRRQA